MENLPTKITKNELKITDEFIIEIPNVIVELGGGASFRFAEYFKSKIRNPNTRLAYTKAVIKFLNWCETHNLAFNQINPIILGEYFDSLKMELQITTVKQHHSAIKKFFDWMVMGHFFPINPMYSVEAPKYSQRKGKTPVMEPEEARQLLDSIDTTTTVGLRDKAVIGLMLYSFARVGAVLNMNVEDYFLDGRRWKIRLIEKGSHYRELPLNHKAEEYLVQYIEAAGIQADKKTPLFRAFNPKRELTDNRFKSRDCLDMIKRRARKAGLSDRLGNHSCRGTGITAFLKNGGSLADAQEMAGHADIKTTRLYDRRGADVTAELVEMVGI
ncbi:MAG: tyrosine-type recombinase/integrase [Caldilineaceae bacterium]